MLRSESSRPASAASSVSQVDHNGSRGLEQFRVDRDDEVLGYLFLFLLVIFLYTD